jgi:hypothetical protein
MTSRVFVLGAHPEARRRALQRLAETPDGFVVRIEPPKRSSDANARMWVLLGALADQVVWHGQKLSAAEWKDMVTAAIKRQKVIPGIDGGFVVLGTSTSAMSRAEMAELQDFIEAFGAQQGVDFGQRETAAA